MTAQEGKEITAEITGVDITPSNDGGVLKEIISEGVGEEKPIPGDKVSVHYVGTLEDGTEFDSSRSRGQQFEFDLGQGTVIKAWDIGVATMKKGEKARLTCRSDYAYGETGSPPKIPPDATLIFEVELFSWKGEDISEEKDGSIIKHLIQKGEGYQTPNDEATVKVHYVGKCNNEVYEDREVEFILGEGDEAGVIPGLEVALKKMKKMEKCRLEITSEKAYGSQGNENFNIPPNAELQFDVEMLQFEKAKESWEMSGEEKLEQSNIVKSKGTNYFKAGKFSQAELFYKKIVSMLDTASDLDKGEEKEQRDSLLLAAHLNLALCYLKLGRFLDAEHECDSALVLDSNSVKAYFRRGQSRQDRADYEMAIKDFQKALELDPSNKAAKNHSMICSQQIKQFQEKEKKKYFGMFSKFAAADSKKNAHSDTLDDEGSAAKEDTNKADVSENPVETPSTVTNGDAAMDVDSKP